MAHHGNNKTYGSTPTQNNIVDKKTHTTSNVTTEEGQLLISDELMWQFNLYIYILVLGAISIFGTVSNTSNMVVFYKLHLKDSMSVCLFALSLSDFLVSAIVMVGRACPIWNIFYRNEGIDPMALLYIGPAWMADSLFLASGWILTILSLERCVCVVFPFKVKDIFTRDRSIVAVVVVFALTVSTYIPIYMTQWMRWVDGEGGSGREALEGPEVNVTSPPAPRKSRHLVIVFSEDRFRVEAAIAIFSSTLIPVPPLVITMGSVVWMVYGLADSSRLRKVMTSGNVLDSKAPGGGGGGGTGGGGGIKDSTNMAHKTRKLIKVVLTLAVIFLVCSIPRIIAKSINTIFPEINEGGRGRNLNNFIWQFARFSACLNASVNIFVYLKINSSYRAKFREIFFPKAYRVER